MCMLRNEDEWTFDAKRGTLRAQGRMQISPMSMEGLNIALVLPLMFVAAAVAKRPNVWPSASMMYHCFLLLTVSRPFG